MPAACKPTPDPPHLTTEELAERWKMSPGSLRNRRLSGSDPPYLKIGGAVRYRWADIIAFENANTATSTTQEQTK